MKLPCGCVIVVKPDTTTVVCRHRAWATKGLTRGMGDHIERLLSYAGGTHVKLLYHRITGRHCNCESRKAALNRLSLRLWRVLAAWITRTPRP